ncbi:FAD-dependent oxidoreductase [Parachlamydia acanthamoebae]|uniref:FAD-dependent oxidoreductase n=1 Tax=Parachlamydia acanthamoebae TaxID=83552 RepID=UPI000750B15C|nr:FAD-dependent monooxygenase [Parachlamydia acanthamoebae]
MKVDYDVVIIGAGPIGISTACALKAMNKKLKICVLDKRPTATRTHGLKIYNDSIAKISHILHRSRNKENSSQVDIQQLKAKFKEWKKHFVPTDKIEADLKEIAKGQGIKVKRKEAYELTENHLQRLLDDTSSPESDQKILQILRNAKVVIGADGAHSVVRKKVMGNKLAEKKTRQYVVQLKYQTVGDAKPRNFFDASAMPLGGFVDFELMSKANKGTQKPVTLNVVVDKKTYEALKPSGTENTKGTFRHPWSLEEIQEKSKTDKKVYRVYRNFLKNLKTHSDYTDAKVSTIELATYRSKESVKNHNGKIFLLVGDANSGMILGRGFNKGLKEAGLCAQAVAKFFEKEHPETGSIPDEFMQYQREAKKTFSQEKIGVKIKVGIIKTANLFAKLFWKIRCAFRRIIPKH